MHADIIQVHSSLYSSRNPYSLCLLNFRTPADVADYMYKVAGERDDKCFTITAGMSLKLFYIAK